MLKITKTIVNGNRELIGFVMEGKEKEFGGFSNDKVTRPVSTSQLIQTRFSNNQIAVKNNLIVPIGSFRINNIPMTVLAGDTYIDIDNTVNIIQRFVQNNENVGFRVRFSDGSEDNIRYQALLMMANWFRPGNFTIKSSSKGKQYICGKQGVSLDDIPAHIIGDNNSTAKRTKPAAKEMDKEVSGNLESGYDILDIYNFIDMCNGYIIKLPSEDYQAASEGGETTTEGFTSLEIGEVASPKPKFNPTKLNVNAGFKKVGMVSVNAFGRQQDVVSYVFRTKSIFLNGDNYMSKFGIAVPTEKEKDLMNNIGGSLAIESINDSTVTGPLGQVINAKELSFYKVDASKVDLISKKKREESIMSASELADLCRKQYEIKLIEKAMGPKGGLMKTLKEKIGNDGAAEATNRDIAKAYAMYSTDALKALEEAGIDIYTGAYRVPGEHSYSSKSTGDSIAQVEIEYTLNGYDASKITGSKILQLVNDNDSSIPESAAEFIKGVLSIADPIEQYAAANELYKRAVARQEEIGKKLWLHNASMYLNGNKTKIHTHDAKSWVIDTSSRVRTATVFACKEKGCEGLRVKFKGVTI